jgi:L-lysine exporter family protein LysE/ArgO
MGKYLVQGLLLGLAYVAPIGTQNLYVINTAVRKSRLRALQVALITVFFDITLALSCFFGIGFLIEKSSIVKGIILFAGSGLVIYIGYGLVRSSAKLSEDVKLHDSILKIIASCFAVTWLNPQALIDGSLLLGGMRASLPGDMSKYFILGVCIASFLWFTFLAGIISIFRSKFDLKVIRWINIICGTIIIFYGLKLAYSFIKLIS